MKRQLTFLTIFAVVLIAGCASQGEEPVSLLAQAETSLNQARSSDALQHAPAAYRQAEEHLEEAKSAIDKEEYAMATLALEKSIADSNYAMVKANAEKTKMSANQIERDLEVLRQEAFN